MRVARPTGFSRADDIYIRIQIDGAGEWLTSIDRACATEVQLIGETIDCRFAATTSAPFRSTDPSSGGPSCQTAWGMARHSGGRLDALD